jgi:hypothetical protein
MEFTTCFEPKSPRSHIVSELGGICAARKLMKYT